MSLRESAVVSVSGDDSNFENNGVFKYTSSIPEEIRGLFGHQGPCRPGTGSHRPCIRKYLAEGAFEYAGRLCIQFGHMDILRTIVSENREFPKEWVSRLVSMGYVDDAFFLIGIRPDLISEISRGLSSASRKILEEVSRHIDIVRDTNIGLFSLIGDYIRHRKRDCIDFLVDVYGSEYAETFVSVAVEYSDVQLFQNMISRIPVSHASGIQWVSSCLRRGRMSFLEMFRDKGILDYVLRNSSVSELVKLGKSINEWRPRPRTLLFMVENGFPFTSLLKPTFTDDVSERINTSYLDETEPSWATKVMLMASEEGYAHVIRLMTLEGFAPFPEMLRAARTGGHENTVRYFF